MLIINMIIISKQKKNLFNCQITMMIYFYWKEKIPLP